MASGIRKQILEFFNSDQNWHEVDEIAERFSLTRDAARRTLYDIHNDGLLSKVGFDYAITQKGVSALTRPAMINAAARHQTHQREMRDRRFLTIVASSPDWWTTPALILAVGDGQNRNTILLTARRMLSKGWIEYQPSAISKKIPEYRITEEGREALKIDVDIVPY